MSNEEPLPPKNVIIDGHTHLASMRYVPIEFMDGIVENTIHMSQSLGIDLDHNKVLGDIVESHQDHEGHKLISNMDKLNIAQSVVLLPDFTYVFSSCSLTIEEMFIEHGALCKDNVDRFSVFAGVDPRWGKDGLDLFIRGIEQYGFSGLKLYPPCGYRADNALLTPFYEYCDEHKLPVLLHIGPTSPVLSFSETMPMFIDAPAKRYKNISFILAHGAANYVEDCVQLCRYRSNVYLDLSGIQTQLKKPHILNQLFNLLNSDINHKIIFGTDWPISKYIQVNKYLLDVLQDRKAHGASKMDVQNILSGNILRILNRKVSTSSVSCLEEDDPTKIG